MTEAELRAFSEELKKAADAARRLAQEHSNLLSSSARSQQDLTDATDDLSDTLGDAAKNTKNMTAEQRKAHQRMLADKKAAKEATDKVKKAAEELEKTVAQFGDTSKEAAESQKKLTQAREEETQAQSAAAQSTSDFDLSVKGAGKSARFAALALDWFGTSLKAQGKQLVEQYKAAGGIVEGSGGLFGSLIEQQNTALLQGLSGVDMQKLVNTNRQVINAMGGTAKSMEELDPAITRFRILTGSSAEAAELAAAAATDFAKKGIQPSARAIEAYTNDMVEMRKRTGLSYDAIHQMFDEVAGEADTIAILRAARVDEREAILASQRALMQQSIAAGMSAEQAKNAAKMLSKMAAAKPLDRLRQAAKIRALGGAMGVAGAEEAAQAVIAGKRMTDEQRANLNKFSQDMTNTMDTMAGQGLGSEIFGSVLLEKLDLEQYYGPNSDFSTTLGSTMKPVVDAINALKDESKGPNAEIINNAILRIDQAMLLLSGQNWLGTAISGLTAAVLGLTTMIAAKKFLDTMGGVGVGRPNSTSNGKPGGRGALIKGGIKGGLVGAGMMAANQFIDEESTAGKIVNSKAAQGAGYGAMVGSVVPGVGTLVGGAVGGVVGGGMDLYDYLTSPDQAPTEMKPVSQQKRRELTAEAADEDMKIATLSMADNMTKQIQQMDASNILLKQLADNSTKQVELSEKQLIALTLTEKEKTETMNRTNLRRDNKFGATYNYV